MLTYFVGVTMPNFPPMFKNLVALNSDQHRVLKYLPTATTIERVKKLNSALLCTTEFREACREFPIVFSLPMKDAQGRATAPMPMALFGFDEESNLFVKNNNWTAFYRPAYVMRYPFALARTVDQKQVALCIDDTWEGFSTSQGNPLFDSSGKPTEDLSRAKTFAENFEVEVDKTKKICQQFWDMGIFKKMSFQAKSKDGKDVTTNFMVVDEAKLQALDEKTILYLHQSGLRSLIEMHLVSLGIMYRMSKVDESRKAS